MALTVIPMAMICGHTLAADLTQPEIQQIDSYWADARKNQEWLQKCSDGDGLAIPEHCYEKALALHPDLARRDGAKLTIKLANNKKTYLNEVREDGFTKFEFLGYIAELDVFVIRYWFSMDTSSDVLISRKTGKEMANLYGSPLEENTLKFNAAGDKMLDYNISESNAAGLQVYRYDRNAGFKRIYVDVPDYASKLNPKLGRQHSCLEWEGVRASGERLYLEEFEANWSKDNVDEIVLNTKYMGDNFYTKHTCNITSN